MKKTLIYIIGAGRSGTTLLDIMLGNMNDAVSLGEINRFYKRHGVPPKREETSKAYKFWEKFRKLLNTKDYTKSYNYAQNNEYHSSFIKAIRRKNNTDYIKDLKQQYDVLREITNEKILVESSKYPSRALNLSSYINDNFFEIKYIYLKKDPVKVVKSFQKKNVEQPSKGYFMANIYYLSVNILCQLTVVILKKRHHKVAVVKYEDLVENPQSVVKYLCKTINEDFTALVSKLSQNKELNTGLLFDGNRIRLKETLTLRTGLKNEKKSFKDYITRILNYIVYR